MEKYLVIYMFLYVLYIIGFTIVNFFVRRQAVFQKQVKMSYFRAYTSPGTEKLEIYSNHFTNQFQVPVIFMITCLVSIQFQTTTQLTLILAGLFIISRIIHAWIHLTHNHVIYRAMVFGMGGLIGLAMWIEILISIF